MNILGAMRRVLFSAMTDRRGLVQFPFVSEVVSDVDEEVCDSCCSWKPIVY